MAKKRPSYISIRRRQRNIVEGMGTRDIKYAQTAKEFGVTRRELRTFLETKPKDLRRMYNRNPAYTRLYELGKRSEVSKTLGIKRVRRYEVLEQLLAEPRIQRYPNSKQIGRIIQRYYYANNFGGIGWAIYTREHDLPLSITAIKLLFRNDKLTNDQYVRAVDVWRDLYGIKQAIYDDYMSIADTWDATSFSGDAINF